MISNTKLMTYFTITIATNTKQVHSRYNISYNNTSLRNQYCPSLPFLILPLTLPLSSPEDSVLSLLVHPFSKNFLMSVNWLLVTRNGRPIPPIVVTTLCTTGESPIPPGEPVSALEEGRVRVLPPLTSERGVGEAVEELLLPGLVAEPEDDMFYYC